MTTVAGVDCSTQSTKVVVVDADSGALLAQRAVAHPEGSEVDPEHWWRAFLAASDGLPAVAAIAVTGQQHGVATLDGDGRVVRPALLWNDTRSAADAAALRDELGPAQWAEAVGSVPVASFTVTKLRWLAGHEPENAARVRSVCLPHDWVTSRLTGGPAVTDRGDASGTGYWSPGEGRYRPDLLELAFGRPLDLPDVLAPAAAAGTTAAGALVAAGTGDNMGAALGLGLAAGDVVVSLGTSGTVFAVSDRPTADATGAVAGFADATGRYLPLVCTLNAARVLEAAARMLGTDLAGLDALALQAPPGAEGLVLLPYLDGERTPDLPDATGTLVGLTRASMRPEAVARAAVEGMLCGLADGLDAVRALGVPVRRALLIGGASRSAAVRAVAADLLGVPVRIPAPAEYVALGAARQAAWALTGAADPPGWPVPAEHADAAPGESGPAVREQYAAARRSRHGR